LLYTHLAYLFWVWLQYVDKSLSMLLLVVNAILTSVFFNNFVMNLVSLPTYVNLAHFVLRVFCFLTLLFVLRILCKIEMLYL